VSSPAVPLDAWPDRDLVVAFKGGVPDAYDEMYRRYSARVYQVCRRMLGSTEDAREATQETFLKAFTALPRFNGEYRLGAWLARIAANVCVDTIRRRHRTAVSTPLTESHEAVSTDLGPEDVVVQDLPALRALDQMQPLHARALRLRNLQGMSHREIAEQLSLSPIQVKALLHRARVSFKRAWDEASGWALAPLFTMRAFLHQSTKDVGGVAPMPLWSQVAAPLLAEKVTASAMVVAIAISGAVAASSASADRAPAAAEAFAAVDRDASSNLTNGDDQPARAAKDEGIVDKVAALLDDVQEAADGDKKEERRGDQDRREEEEGLPTDPDKASSQVVREVNDTLEDVLPQH
jgi:RNA polymerase sigma-70 factor (ECF subfamily)